MAWRVRQSSNGKTVRDYDNEAEAREVAQRLNASYHNTGDRPGDEYDVIEVHGVSHDATKVPWTHKRIGNR